MVGDCANGFLTIVGRFREMFGAKVSSCVIPGRLFYHHSNLTPSAQSMTWRHLATIAR